MKTKNKIKKENFLKKQEKLIIKLKENLVRRKNSKK
tara:strand:- start:862 stop:969 length:108 start_codon:yes stop_codon:yes gene_type:complete